MKAVVKSLQTDFITLAENEIQLFKFKCFLFQVACKGDILSMIYSKIVIRLTLYVFDVLDSLNFTYLDLCIINSKIEICKKCGHG